MRFNVHELGLRTHAGWAKLKKRRIDLSDKVYGNDAKRYERVKLAVIAGDDLAAEFLGKRDTKAVG
jgi:hypothetical protein